MFGEAAFSRYRILYVPIPSSPLMSRYAGVSHDMPRKLAYERGRVRPQTDQQILIRHRPRVTVAGEGHVLFHPGEELARAAIRPRLFQDRQVRVAEQVLVVFGLELERRLAEQHQPQQD